MDRPKGISRDVKPVSLRIPPKLSKKIANTANIMGLENADVIRLATEIGLQYLERIDYDVAKAILDAGRKHV